MINTEGIKMLYLWITVTLYTTDQNLLGCKNVTRSCFTANQTRTLNCTL